MAFVVASVASAAFVAFAGKGLVVGRPAYMASERVVVSMVLHMVAAAAVAGK